MITYQNQLIGITGGIGSGKSVVARILRAYGYPVYDCDQRAKQIMDTDLSIISKIASNVSQSAINGDGTINRGALAEVVFNDANKLKILNSIVHGAVKDDLLNWRLANNSNAKCFVETAILYESGLDAIVDKVWVIDAPKETRVGRVIKRNGLSRQQVECRMASQCIVPQNPHLNQITIFNDDRHSLLLQIEKALSL